MKVASEAGKTVNVIEFDSDRGGTGEKEGTMVRETLENSSDCGGMSTVCRNVVSSNAGGVLSGKGDKATRSCFELPCSVLPPV